MKKTIFDKLKRYSENNIIPMHMPGHKRTPLNTFFSDMCKLDITEIDGFDNLHSPETIIKEAQIRASRLYGCDASFFLVSGSTCGILSAITAVCKRGDKILVARNSHKSVYNAIELNELEPIFIFPEYKNGIAKSIDPRDIENSLLQNQDISLVVITSPTYEGIISDVNKIAEITHKFNIPLMVDCAHGAHLKFFCENYENNADITVTSLHKTLPVLNQGALLNLRGTLVSKKDIADKLSIFQTSSPSYIIMSSIDDCISTLSQNADVLFDKYKKNLKEFDTKVSKLQKLKVLFRNNDPSECEGIFGVDYGKIVISGENSNLSGQDIMNIFREKYSIELEMAYGSYALAMTSICDSEENFNRLATAIKETDKTATGSDKFVVPAIPKPERFELKSKEYELTDIKNSQSRISSEYIFAYPPGIPIIAPGERIDKDVLDYFDFLEKNGTNLKHSITEEKNTVAVFK